MDGGVADIWGESGETKLIDCFLYRFLMVFTCLTLSVFSTIETYEDMTVQVLTYMESFVVVWFAVEFSLRYVVKTETLENFAVRKVPETNSVSE